MKRLARSSETGATLVVSLIMLVLITLMILAALAIGSANFKTVTNMQFRDEAVAAANDTAFGLAAGIWTTDVKRAHRVAASVHAGTVWVNTYGMFDAAIPYGGFKLSGYGKELGREALDQYLQTKTVWVDLA